MKQEIAKKWIDALRSGEYKQTTGFLKTETGHCCLGVLCELFMKETHDVNAEYFWRDVTIGPSISAFITSTADCDFDELKTLPGEVRDWADMNSRNGYRRGALQPLTELNDNGCTFEDIANVIEEEWENL